MDVELTTSPVRDTAGEVTGASKIARDIGDRRRAEEMRAVLLRRAEAARDDADAANRTKDQFLAVLSHELRTPLAAMLGWIQMLRNRQVPAERTQHALDVIHRNTVLQARLIDDLLDVFRIETGKLHLDKQPVPLIPLIERRCNGMSSRGSSWSAGTSIPRPASSLATPHAWSRSSSTCSRMP